MTRHTHNSPMWSKVSRSKFVMCKLRERSSCCSVNCYSFSILSSFESWEEHNTRQVRKTRTCQCLLNLSSKQKQHKKSIEETKGDYDDVGREGGVSFNLQIMHVLQKVYDISNTLSFSRALSITPNRCLSLLCSIRGKLPKLHVVCRHFPSPFFSFPLVKRFNLGSPSSGIRYRRARRDGNEASRGTIWNPRHTPAATPFNKWQRIFVLLTSSRLVASATAVESAYCKVSLDPLCDSPLVPTLSKAYFTFMDFRWLISHWWIVQ